MQTDNASAVVTVTQEDREAAKRIAQAALGYLNHALKHLISFNTLTEAIEPEVARHRLASQSESTARVEALEKALRWALAEIDGQNLYTGGVDFTPDEQRDNAFDRAEAALHVEGAGS
jgi:hypothetical protein